MRKTKMTNIEEVEVAITLTKTGSLWILSSKDEPNATIRYASRATALTAFESVLQISSVPWRQRNKLVKEAMKLGK